MAVLLVLFVTMGLVIPLYLVPAWQPKTVYFVIGFLILWGGLLFGANHIFNQKFIQHTAHFYEKCDPEVYFAQMKKRYKATFCRRDEYRVLVQMAVALICLDKVKDAVLTLEQIDPARLSEKNDQLKFDYLDVLADAYIRRKDNKKAELYLEDMKELIAFSKHPLFQKDSWKKRYLTRKYQLAINLEKYTTAEEFFHVAYQLAVCEYDKVMSKFYIGVSLLQRGCEQEALEALQYVILNANRLSVKGEAKQMTISILHNERAKVVEENTYYVETSN